MIQIDHLSKRYGEKYAVKDASFTVEKGEILVHVMDGLLDL